MANASVLIISDQHQPFAHADIHEFLKALKHKYKPDKIINIGDEIDGHSLSFHEHNSELPSPSDELKTAINRMQPLYKLFPKMDLVESNHGSLVYRRAKAGGLPLWTIKSYRDILSAPKGWRWHKDITLTLSNGSKCYFCHTKGSDIQRVSQSMGMSVVAGHMHERFEIRYWANSLGLYFGMHVGCLIEDDSLAFSYNKLNLKRPMIGCGIILNGLPKLLPMVLNSYGRWNKEAP
jgi:hypothetical protein